jgi:hypothetical protein
VVATLTERAEEIGDEFDLLAIRCVQASALTLFGRAQEATGLLEPILTSGHDSGRTDMLALGLCAAAMVRAALSIGELELAEPMVGVLTSRLPCADHASLAARAALAEARGDHAVAAEGHADAPSRWEAFEMAPEQGFALLGQGRCLLELGRLGEAAEVLGRAREIFARCGMRPALEETDERLAEATALSS